MFPVRLQTQNRGRLRNYRLYCAVSIAGVLNYPIVYKPDEVAYSDRLRFVWSAHNKFIHLMLVQETTSKELEEIDRSDRCKFTALYHANKEKVFEYAFLLTQSSFHAEEVVQEVFLKIWVIRRQLAAIKNLDGWLYTMARNKTLDHLRKISCELEVQQKLRTEGIVAVNSTLEGVESRQERLLVMQALETLSPQKKTVYLLIREGGLKREEVARLLRLSPHTVRVHLQSALRQIRSIVKEE
jgi:RNA polymerase sigma-70 factor (family 1)